MTASREAPRCNPRHGWLAAVLPAEAQRFRVLDASLATTLADAGAELVENRPDLELAPPGKLRGDARWALVALDAGAVETSPPPEGRARAVRAALRIARSADVRLRAVVARRALRARGYSRPRTILWDQERPLRLPGSGGRAPLDERFPLGALVSGARGPHVPTLLERAAAEGSERAGQPLRLDRLRTASWGILVLSETMILRVAVGPGRRQLEGQARELNALRARAPTLETLVPWPLACGRAGIADWLLEPRLPGAQAAPLPGDRLLASALDVLAALHAAGERRSGAGSPAADAETLAAAVSAAEAGALREFAHGLESRLAELPRSFGHGDFSPANLLERSGNLTGVVDWNKAAQGRLPLLDLLNLLLTIEVARSGRGHGRVFVEHLLPWARIGGDEIARGFCRRAGLELREGLLEDLAGAWWLDRHAHQVATYSDRLKRPAWLQENIERPLRAILRR